MPSEPRQSTSTEDKGKAMETNAPRPMRVITYPPESSAQGILDTMNKHREEGKFCDIQLKLSQSRTIFAHKAILAQSSEFFELMFASDFIESASGEVDVSHLADNPETIESVIKSFYGQAFELTIKNVYDVLNMAEMLCLEPMKEMCSLVIQGNIYLENMPSLIQIAMNFSLEALQQQIAPIIGSRFHDFILLQEDILELSPSSFEYLISHIKTKFICRKAEYILFVLKWYSRSETEERAELMLRALDVEFKISRHTYMELEGRIETIKEHLDDANAFVDAQTREELLLKLAKLQPDGIANERHLHSLDALCDSDLEDLPPRERCEFDYKWPEYGPRTKEKGYTEKEQEMYVKHHADMAEAEQHREWAAKYPQKFSLRGDDDPNRPKRIRREVDPKPYPNRNFHVKTDEEILEESKLLSGIVVLAPSSINGFISNDTLDVSIYITRKRGWYKITRLNMHSIMLAFPGYTKPSDKSKEPPRMKIRNTLYGAAYRDQDSDDDDEYGDSAEMKRMMHMMRGAEPRDMMMIMHSMPPSIRRRMEREMMRGRMPRSMEMFGGIPFEMMDDHRSRGMNAGQDTEVRLKAPPPLSDILWKILYFKHRLYFYHQLACSAVYCHDIEKSSWSQLNFDLSVEKKDEDERKLSSIADGIELAVMGRTLYAVVRIVHPDYHQYIRYMTQWRREQEDEKEITVHARYKIFKLNESEQKFDHRNTTTKLYIQIPIDKEKKVGNDKETEQDKARAKERRLTELFMMQNIPMKPLRHGLFTTILFVENDETLHIFTGHKTDKYYLEKELRDDETVFQIATYLIYYADSNESDSVGPYSSHKWIGDLIPVEDDRLVFLLNSMLDGTIMINLEIPVDQNDSSRVACWKQTHVTDYYEGMKGHPRRQFICVGDDKSMWVIRGKDDNTSELMEVYMVAFNRKVSFKRNTAEHTPPPYRLFTMGCCAKFDPEILRNNIEPLTYQHVE
ncbi:uncharacterized protein LOC127877568 [Dreissena polymorpha]|uniref:BTB domain-containing protein n=1 Tax=Dreissena polymorpha TaxID=45954 RepID=A0A9D4H6C8_DREPO|nr:uncharacterized protein LOC127877568 [Dreissena polymorpha]XP_052279503.1 uncharacterized protein LOC127877568 [Dreissena polymorpha]KAH3830379.1 hypothetical protein DPMN_103622 [Dreissena polymorpha]